MAQSTFNIFARMVLEDDKFKNQLNKQSRELRSQLKSQEKQWKQYGQAFENTGKKMVLAFGSIAVAATTSYIKFEDKIANINTLLDDTTNLEGYKNAILDLGSEIGINSDIMADGMYQTISSIGDMGEQTEKMFAIMAKGAKAGGAEVSDSVALISAGMKGFGQVNEETAMKISDLAFQTAKLGVTTFPEMASSMKPLFPLASTLNISLEELFGSMATLTGVTGNTAEVTTQMKAVMSNLIKPTTQMQKVIKKYGFENGSAMIKSKGFTGVLEILKKETKGNSAEMGKLFSSTEALTALLALTGEQFDTYVDKTGQMTKATGATDTAFGKLEDTMKFKIDKAIVQVKNSFIKLGEKFAPIALDMIEGVGNLADKISKLDDDTIKNIANFIKWGIGLGAGSIAVGKVCKAIGSFNGFLASCNKFLVKNSDSSGKSKVGLMSLLKKGINPTTLALIGGAGLLVALGSWVKKNNEVTKGIDAVKEKTKTMKKEIVDASGQISEIELDFSEEYKGELEKVTKYWEDNLVKINDYPDKLTKGSKALIKANLDEIKNYDKEYNAEVKKNRKEALADFEKENAQLKQLSKETYEAKKKDFLATFDEAVKTENKIIDEINNIHKNAQKRGYYTEEDKEKLQQLTEEMVRIAGAGLSKHLEDIVAFEMAKEEIYGKLTEKGKMLAEKKYNDIADNYQKEKDLMDQHYADINAQYQAGTIDYDNYRLACDGIAKLRMDTVSKLEQDQSEWLQHMRETYKHDEEAQKWLDGVEKNMQTGKKTRMNETVGILSNMGYTKEQIMQKMGISENEYTNALNSNKDRQSATMSEQEKRMRDVKDKKAWLTKELKRLGYDETVNLNTFTDQQVDKLSELIRKFTAGKTSAEDLQQGINNLKSKEITIKTNYIDKFGTVKRNAKGTEYFEGGLTWINERGAELVSLPRGTKINNARETKHIENTKKDTEQIVSVNIDGIEIARAIGKYMDKELGKQKGKRGW